jgi:tetratricopeptide (TPR) repeat protein
MWLLAILFGGSFLASCGNSQSHLQGHVERGKQYLAAGNLEKASIEFRNALQIDSTDDEALYLNGQVEERRGHLREAVEQYQAAVDAQPENNRARARLAKLLVLGGVPARALQLISPALATHPGDADLLAARAAARHELKNDGEAQADAERAVQLAPTNENAIAVLAALALRSGDSARAVKLVKDAADRAPGSIELRRILVSIYSSTHQIREAEEAMRKVIALEPNEIAPRMELAAHFAESHELDEAQQVLEQAVRELPQKDTAKLALVDFITTQRSRQQGEQVLRDFVAHEPEDEDLRLALGMLVQRGGATQEALAIYREIIQRQGKRAKGLAARDRIASIELLQGHEEEAKRLIAEVLTEDPRDNDALIMRANIALLHNDPGNAVVDLRAALHDQPRSVVLQRTLARAYLAKGEPALAEDALRVAVDSAPEDATVRVNLAQVLLQTDRPSQAVALLEETQHKAPQDPQVRLALIRAYIADHNLPRARSAADELGSLHPDLAEGYYLAGLIAHEQNRLDESEKNLERALELQPSSVDILTSLIRFTLERGRGSIAVARLQRARAREPGNLQISDLLGGTYLELHDLARAQETFNQAIASAPRSWVAYRGLAQVKLAQGDPAGAIDQYRIALTLAPTQPRVLAELAPLYEKQGRIDAALTCYQDLYDHSPGARQLAANNLAMMLVTYRTDRASLERAQALTAGFETTDSASLLDTAGWVRFKRRQYHDAVVLLERAADRSPDARLIHFHLGMAQLRLGEREHAQRNLEFALSGSGSFTGADEARSALASLKAARSG